MINTLTARKWASTQNIKPGNKLLAKGTGQISGKSG
jgi:hypothetical protein